VPASRRRPSPSLAAQTFAKKCGIRMPSGARPICAGRRAVSAVRPGSVAPRAARHHARGRRLADREVAALGVTVLQGYGRFIMGYQLDGAAESYRLER
jgi:hypothetical protein